MIAYLLEGMLRVRPYLEVAYFAAGILLVLGIVITFIQLLLIKNDVRLRNERAAKERAIEASGRYLNNYVSLCDACFHALLDKKLDYYSGPIGDFSSSSIPAFLLPHTIKRMEGMKFHPMLNELETIAAYFTTGVAHEKTGFLIIGRTYCGTVDTYYDIIAPCRDTKAHPFWNNIVELYQIWRPRLTKAELQTTIRDLEGKIRAMGPDMGSNRLAPN